MRSGLMHPGCRAVECLTGLGRAPGPSRLTTLATPVRLPNFVEPQPAVQLVHIIVEDVLWLVRFAQRHSGCSPVHIALTSCKLTPKTSASSPLKRGAAGASPLIQSNQALNVLVHVLERFDNLTPYALAVHLRDCARYYMSIRAQITESLQQNVAAVASSAMFVGTHVQHSLASTSNQRCPFPVHSYSTASTSDTSLLYILCASSSAPRWGSFTATNGDNHPHGHSPHTCTALCSNHRTKLLNFSHCNSMSVCACNGRSLIPTCCVSCARPLNYQRRAASPAPQVPATPRVASKCRTAGYITSRRALCNRRDICGH